MRQYIYIALLFLFMALASAVVLRDYQYRAAIIKVKSLQMQLQLSNASIDEYKRRGEQAQKDLLLKHEEQNKKKRIAIEDMMKEQDKLVVSDNCMEAIHTGALEGIKINAAY